MEVFGVPVTASNIAFTLAGLIAAVWGGSKVPWQAAIARLLSAFKSDGTAVTTDRTVDVDDPGDDVMVALRILHEHASDAESHKLVSAVEADFWQKRAKAAAAESAKK